MPCKVSFMELGGEDGLSTHDNGILPIQCTRAALQSNGDLVLGFPGHVLFTITEAMEFVPSGDV